MEKNKNSSNQTQEDKKALLAYEIISDITKPLQLYFYLHSYTPSLEDFKKKYHNFLFKEKKANYDKNLEDLALLIYKRDYIGQNLGKSDKETLANLDEKVIEEINRNIETFRKQYFTKYLENTSNSKQTTYPDLRKQITEDSIKKNKVSQLHSLLNKIISRIKNFEGKSISDYTPTKNAGIQDILDALSNNIIKENIHFYTNNGCKEIKITQTQIDAGVKQIDINKAIDNIANNELFEDLIESLYEFDFSKLPNAQDTVPNVIANILSNIKKNIISNISEGQYKETIDKKRERLRNILSNIEEMYNGVNK